MGVLYVYNECVHIYTYKMNNLNKCHNAGELGTLVKIVIFAVP